MVNETGMDWTRQLGLFQRQLYLPHQNKITSHAQSMLFSSDVPLLSAHSFVLCYVLLCLIYITGISSTVVQSNGSWCSGSRLTESQSLKRVDFGSYRVYLKSAALNDKQDMRKMGGNLGKRARAFSRLIICNHFFGALLFSTEENVVFNCCVSIWTASTRAHCTSLPNKTPAQSIRQLQQSFDLICSLEFAKAVP